MSCVPLGEIQAFDFHYRTEFVVAEARWKSAKARAVRVVDGDFSTTFAVLLNSLPNGAVVATSPYGYGGPHAGFFDRKILKSFAGFARDQGWTTVFLRGHPLHGAAPAHECDDGLWKLLDTGTVAIVDGSGDAHTARYSKGLRRDLARAKREGLIVQAGPLADEVDSFGRFYRSAMDRLSARPELRYTDEYLASVAHALSGSARSFTIYLEGQRVASACFVVEGSYGHYYLSAADYDFELAGYAMKLVVSTGLDWCFGMGVSSVNMGGGLGGATDGLLAFKLRFGGEKIPFQTFRIIPDSTNFESAFQVPAIEALSGNPFPPLEESC